ncbi:HAD-IIB family hydrolase [Candidatus Saccharibacteria bacterium]|nr:HAD-IIB family hydrolase [Candidatus Saccharibacteria bacterium]MCL1963213.1 HAD-IIB family hydrolase [Candidatus Saccharibacteria bacterium]
MKKVLSFDVDQTLNIAKTPIKPEMAKLLVECLDRFEIAPISGQKYDQFLIQIVDPLKEAGVTDEQLARLHLFVTQGTRYYRYNVAKKDWDLGYQYDLTPEQVEKMTYAIETAAKELGYWESDKVPADDEIIENRVSQVTFSALGQKASPEIKYPWDPDMKKREKIVARAQELAPEFMFEIGGTTSINAALPGTNKVFGMTHLLEELKVTMDEVLYFGDMTQPGGNDYPVVEMGFDTITVRDWEETANVLRGILWV